MPSEVGQLDFGRIRDLEPRVQPKNGNGHSKSTELAGHSVRLVR